MTGDSRDYANNSRRFIIFLLSSFIFSLGSSIITSIFPHFILKLNIEMKLLGLIGTISSTLSTALRVPFSAAMSSIGYFRTTCMSYTLVALSRVFYSLANLSEHAIILFSVGYILSGIQFGLLRSARSSVIAYLTEKEKRGFSIGFTSSMMMMATSIGPFIGAIIYELSKDFTLVFLISLLVMILGSSVMFPLMRDDIKGLEDSERSFISQMKFVPYVIKHGGLGKAFALFMIDAFVWSLTFRYVSIYLASYLKAKPADLAQLNLVMTVVSVAGLISAGYVSDKLRRRVVFLVLSEICGILYFTLVLIAKDLTLVYVAYALMGFTISFWGPIASAYVTEKAEELSKDLIPMTVGVWGLLTSLSRMPGGVIGGFIYDINPHLLFETAAALLIVVTLLIALFLRD